MPAGLVVEPLFLVGMRQRAVGLVIAGIGLFGLLTTYVSSIVVALRLSGVAEAATPPAALRVPALPFPTLADDSFRLRTDDAYFPVGLNGEPSTMPPPGLT